MGTLMWLVVIGSAAFVYWDAARNKIGRQAKGARLNLKRKPMFWAIGTWLLLFVFGPLYYFQRQSLMKRAKENPVMTPEKARMNFAIIVGVITAIPFLLTANDILSGLVWAFRNSFSGMGCLFFDALVCLYLAACGVGSIYVYRDATRNNIGAAPTDRELTDASALEWTIGVLMVWFVAFPLYLIKRKTLIQKALQNPVDVPDQQKIVILCVLFALGVVLFVKSFGYRNLMCMAVIGSAAFVYWDAAKHRFGKTSEVRSLDNASPLLWSIGVLLVWIIALPLYLFKRNELIRRAQENSAPEVSTQAKKLTMIFYGFLAGLVLAVAINGLITRRIALKEQRIREIEARNLSQISMTALREAREGMAPPVETEIERLIRQNELAQQTAVQVFRAIYGMSFVPDNVSDVPVDIPEGVTVKISKNGRGDWSWAVVASSEGGALMHILDQTGKLSTAPIYQWDFY